MSSFKLSKNGSYSLGGKHDDDSTSSYIIKLNNQIMHSINTSTSDTNSTITFLSSDQARISIAGETFMIKTINKSTDGGVIVSTTNTNTTTNTTTTNNTITTNTIIIIIITI